MRRRARDCGGSKIKMLDSPIIKKDLELMDNEQKAYFYDYVKKIKRIKLNEEQKLDLCLLISGILTRVGIPLWVMSKTDEMWKIIKKLNYNALQIQWFFSFIEYLNLKEELPKIYKYSGLSGIYKLFLIYEEIKYKPHLVIKNWKILIDSNSAKKQLKKIIKLSRLINQ